MTSPSTGGSGIDRRRTIPHDETTIRERKGEILSIPQAKRYVSRDWLHILAQLPRSVTLRRIKTIVVVNILWTTLIALVNHFAFPFPQVESGHGPTLVTPALGLLLVFRTNAAYNRFWEGRIIWEKITDYSRCLARSAVLYKDTAGTEVVVRIGRLLSAFSIVLKQHLTEFKLKENQFVEQVLLNPEDRISLGRAQNRPLAILHMLGAACHSVPESNTFSSRERLFMLRNVDGLTTCMGSAERIVQTPVPLNYARHTSRFLTFWCLSLPIAIVGELGFATIPVMAMVTWALYGIQEIGLMIEEPFRRSLSLNVFCNTIYTDTMETIQSMLPIKPDKSVPSTTSTINEKNRQGSGGSVKEGHSSSDESDQPTKPAGTTARRVLSGNRKPDKEIRKEASPQPGSKGTVDGHRVSDSLRNLSAGTTADAPTRQSDGNHTEANARSKDGCRSQPSSMESRSDDEYENLKIAMGHKIKFPDMDPEEKKLMGLDQVQPISSSRSKRENKGHNDDSDESGKSVNIRDPLSSV